VGRLDGSLQLVTAHPPRAGAGRQRQRAGAVQQALGLAQHACVPATGVLVGQRHIAASGIAPRGAAGMAVQHQRQQAQGLGLIRQQAGQQAAQPQGLVGQVAALGVGAGGVGPAFGIAGVDGVEHRAQARRQVGQRRHRKRDAGLADARLGPHQALAHGGRRHQKGRADGRRVQAQQRLQHQRRAQRRVDGRVGAGEHQRQPAVGDLVALAGHVGGRLRPLAQQLQRVGRRRVRLAGAGGVDQPVARGGQQPGLGVGRHALGRPGGQGGGEGIGQRVFGRRHVARARRQQRHQLAVAAARHRLGGGGRNHISQIGLTSMVPCGALGQRAAQCSAASRSGTSIMK
jgi:hypothetical protein